ncbi:hypothetical protein LCGC14_1125020 [marine sediment metagenome]|uniref:Superoxide dismutase copper/zinc binding domain-containing protein n=1 Tax=marine sediment metagenome TaxID=412755 RepID=A0A0F9Q8M9_9ZZZZ|nr:superoxide dismutase [Methylophaga aminisulfidivorans]HEC60078.1 superoxide dismutase [Methylophaga sp.]
MKLKYAFLTSLFLTSTAFASNQITVDMTNLKTGESVGTVTISNHPYGTIFTPNLSNLPTGIHGFHVHEVASCGAKKKNGDLVPGGAAGSHYDPASNGQHAEPWSFKGHKGDLPVLYVDEEGRATLPVLSPRLTLKDLSNRSLMIHVNGDNYSDDPKPLGGGGARLACGVIN